jgi:hypothetical protein
MLKAFDLSISSAFSVDIVIIKADLAKYIIRDSRIFEIGYVIKKVIRIGYYRRFFPLSLRIKLGQ